MASIKSVTRKGLHLLEDLIRQALINPALHSTTHETGLLFRHLLGILLTHRLSQ